MSATPAIQPNRLITLHDGNTLNVDDPEVARYLASSVVIPPGPRCARCGHQMCPCCVTWCDCLQWRNAADEIVSYTSVLEALPDGIVDYEICCDGRCVVDVEEARLWSEIVSPLVVVAERLSLAMLSEHGPYQPIEVARARAVSTPRAVMPPCGDACCQACPSSTDDPGSSLWLYGIP